MVADIGAALAALSERRASAALFDDYYRGRHRPAFLASDSQHARYFRELVDRARENLCKTVVRAFAERLAVETWTGPGAAGAEAVWEETSGAANRVHTDALKTGEGFALVWPEAPGGPARVWRQAPGDVAIIDGLAYKLWRDGAGWRLNVYGPAAVARYATRKPEPKPRDFAPHADEHGDAVIPHALGRTPVVRFAHDADVPGGPGTSVLEDVLPLQDILNKQLADLLIASEFFALPMRVFTGVQAEVDPATGRTQAETFDPRRHRTLFFGSEATKAVQLPAADLAAAASLTDATAVKVARVTGVPLHHLVLGSGDFPSGEALRSAEARLVSKVTDLHDEWSGAWSEVMALCGHAAEPVWRDPAHITQTERLERIETRKRLGVPWRRIMLDLGYTHEQIDEMERWRDADREGAAAAMERALDSA